MSTNNEVTQKDLHDLLEIFEKKTYEAGPCEKDTTEYEIMRNCEFLLRQDYTLIVLDNINGSLSACYPSRIYIPECERQSCMTSTILTNNGVLINSSSASAFSCSNMGPSNNSIHAYVTFAKTLEKCPSQKSLQSLLQQQQQFQHSPQTVGRKTLTAESGTAAANKQNTIYEDLYDASKVRELVTTAKYARCRQRFVVPVIMYRGKYICRSATVSVLPETYGRKVVDCAYDYLSGTYNDRTNNVIDDENNEHADDMNESSPFSYSEAIKSDVQLLNSLYVTTIVDLMVEKRKVKYFMTVSSSEKADPENHYESFNILSLPYPGCEFFKKFRDNNYVAENLHYNWKQSFNDAIISIPKLGPAADLDIIWSEYKQWDLVLITQNYLKACLKYIQEENSGLLIHCISGWDRTPLFVSLVRLSLWADNLIHQSLNALQMAYFTLAYDWYLFGHQLPDRLKRGEDIMFFCFHVLKFITDDEFSIVENRKRLKTSSSGSGSSSSVVVIKSDFCEDEPLREDIILNHDQDSNESFSAIPCDIAITENFYTTSSHINQTFANPVTSRSPNPRRSKTSPISVPGASATRQRQESTSSNGSWQVVTDTGSIDSLMNSSNMMHFISQQQQDSNSINSSHSGNSGVCLNGVYNIANTPSNASSSSGGSVNGLNFITHSTENSNATLPTKAECTLRKQRLNAVRTAFIQAYGKTIGLKFKEGSSRSISTLMGNLTDQFF
uniref:Uncharacterized protein n=1 Tax=Glossina austeni TaxID=7395 RepID=A0A1A9VKM3_GLOAU